MIATIVFLVILLGPFLLFVVNAGIRRADNIGIAGGIKKPREAKPPRAQAPKVKRTTMRPRRVSYCGKGLTHFALKVVGSEDACRFCGRLEPVPGQPEGGDSPDAETDAAIAEVEHLLDRGPH